MFIYIPIIDMVFTKDVWHRMDPDQLTCHKPASLDGNVTYHRPMHGTMRKRHKTQTPIRQQESNKVK